MINTIVNYVNFYYLNLKNIKNSENEIKSYLLNRYSEDIIKTALIYRYLYESTFKSNISLENIIYNLPINSISSNSKIITNHLIFYRAFKSFYNRYKVGRGCVYVFDSPIKSEVLGYLTGILYWIFHKGLD